jgi:hypothetical protein
LDHIDRAYLAIDHLKVMDAALYQKLYNRINLESLPYRWLKIRLYPDRYNTVTLNEAKEQLLKDAMELGVTYASENSGIEGLFA